MAECYDYLFEIAVKMKNIGIGKARLDGLVVAVLGLAI